MRVLCLIFLFGLSLTRTLAQGEGSRVDWLLEKLGSNEFAQKYLGSQILPYDLSENFEIFKSRISKKGIFAKNRKISQSLICSKLVDIKFLIDKIDVVTQELNSPYLQFPKDDKVSSSIKSIKNQKYKFLIVRENLDKVKTIKGLTSFSNNHQYFSEILEQSFQLKQKNVEFIGIYLLEKQNLDSAQFRFTLDYIPLQIEKQQIQNHLAFEFTSLAAKLEFYRSKKYKYIKFL